MEKSGKFIPTKDVRQVLTYVETNNVDAGFVYKTDALQSNKVKTVADIPSNTHDMIVYSTGIINTTKHKKEATTFYNFLFSKEAEAIFINNGFKVLK